MSAMIGRLMKWTYAPTKSQKCQWREHVSHDCAIYGIGNTPHTLNQKRREHVSPNYPAYKMEIRTTES